MERFETPDDFSSRSDQEKETYIFQQMEKRTVLRITFDGTEKRRQEFSDESICISFNSAVSCLQFTQIVASKQCDFIPGRTLYKSCQRGKTETHIGVGHLSSITPSSHLLDARLQVFYAMFCLLCIALSSSFQTLTLFSYETHCDF